MSAIRPGDLVMMVRNPCSCSQCRRPLGIPYTVTDIAGEPGELVYCGLRAIGNAPVAHGFADFNIPVSFLIKIDPPAEDESVDAEAEFIA